MRHLLAMLMVTGFLVSLACAQDAPVAAKSPAAEKLAALKAELAAANKKWNDDMGKEYAAARKAGTTKGYKPSRPSPRASFAPRFLAIAEKDPAGPIAFEATRAALNASFTPSGDPQSWNTAIKILRDHYVTRPGLERLIAFLARHHHAETDQFLRDVMDKNPDRAIGAKAYQCLLEEREATARFADQLKNDESARGKMEKREGKQEVEKWISRGPAARKEADELRRKYRDRFLDVSPDISIGQVAPELISVDLDGNPTRLSDLKGKVVVLDFWATWCGPCIAMIPHEREMVARLKDKPFALVSISVDTEKKTLTDFLAKEPMPWQHWWNSGTTGKIIETLNVNHYPTIFVLDQNGVIRFKELRDEALEKAVNTLLEEAKVKPARAA